MRRELRAEGRDWLLGSPSPDNDSYYFIKTLRDGSE